MSDDPIANLIERIRNLAESARQAGRRYEAEGAIASARECYGQMQAYGHATAEIEAALRGVRDSPPPDEGIAKLIATWRIEGNNYCADDLETFWRNVNQTNVNAKE